MGQQRTFHLLLTGGGTGGHLFPALAMAEEICGRLPDAEVLFIGTGRSMDAKGLAGTGYKSKTLISYGMKGKNLLHLLKALVALPVSFFQAMSAIVRFRPDVVFGVGGYVTAPVVVAARLLGVKTVIHEQNSIPGLANRKLGRIAGTVCISLPQSAAYFPASKTVLTGNPVRKGILKLAEKLDKEKDFSAAEEKKSPVLLVLGGSLGAHRVNQLVVQAICESEELSRIQVIHQTGTTDEQWVADAYATAGIRAEVAAFFSDMAAIYARSDLLVSRAGATTLAELAVLGKPAVLIPYPYAADDHQLENAHYYVQGGGCKVKVEKELDSALLAEDLKRLLSSREEQKEMGKCMRALAVPDAASRIADVCLQGSRWLLSENTDV